MTTAEVLRKARDLIADESRWTRGVSARDADGQELADYEGAVQFCAGGAIEFIDSDQYVAATDALDRVASQRVTGHGTPFIWLNDNCTHAEVVAAFDKAIELAEAEGK